MFIVTVDNGASTFFLKSTIWAFNRESAQVFATEEAARAQLQKAKQFMKAKVFKAAKIVPVMV